MDKSFINLRYTGKYTNRPVVSFLCGFVLPISRDNFLKHSGKTTNVDTIIIVISYNWSKNIAKFFNAFSLEYHSIERLL